ncbi:MAG: succinylglutamate desuccinylase/aspartoacylase family protein [Candidatus Hatepunaea meridiana]|nr:succinylglutamate desuccinylase/aspartoacylase family protein [Candidatus Hatepunaea meridiana]
MTKNQKEKPASSDKKTIESEEQQRYIRIGVYMLLILIACLAAGDDFLEQRTHQPIHLSFGLTRTKPLSNYLSSLKGTRGDTDLYIFEGRQSGGNLLIIGGTHPNEPASNVAAVLLVENLKIERGKIIVITTANASGFSASEPQEAFPKTFSITNRRGKERKFRVGSRYSNILDGWPDPVVYRHHPSGQLLSGPETRNLNRAYPGRPNGTLTERVAYAITEVVRKEKIDLVIDLHEAAPEYPVINAIVAHERAMDIAAMAAVDLQIKGHNFNLEPSPVNFRGLSHREIGDFTEAKAILMESAGALQGRLRGPTNEKLVLSSIDACYHKASLLGKLAVDFPEEGIPIELRVGRHLDGIKVLTETLSLFEPDKAVIYSHIPDYEELNKHGVGFYLK